MDSPPIDTGRLVDTGAENMRIAAATLDAGVDHLLRARKLLAPDLMGYQSSQMSLGLVYLACRHIKAIAQCARSEVALDEPAMTLSRAALEASVRALWLVDDNDPWRRERRWHVMLEELARTYRRLSGQLKDCISHQAVTDVERLAASYDALIPSKYPRLTGVPSVEQMMQEAKFELPVSPYFFYIAASQTAHGTLLSTMSKYPSGDELLRWDISESDPSHWGAPFSIAGILLIQPLLRVMRRFGVPTSRVFPSGFKAQITRRIHDAVWFKTAEE